MTDTPTPQDVDEPEVGLEHDVEDDDDFDDDDFDDEEPDPIIRAKWSIDGATTLSEAADKSEAFAGFLRGLEKEGWQLRAAIDDDYGFLKWTGEGPAPQWYE